MVDKTYKQQYAEAKENEYKSWKGRATCEGQIEEEMGGCGLAREGGDY